MPKQNFLSTDFFVAASEAEAKKGVLSLPQHLPHITLLKDNTLIQSLRFLYEHRDKAVQHYIDVTILPLDDSYVRFSLHGSHTNGRGIHADPDIAHALQDFERSVYAAMKNDFSALTLPQKAKQRSTNFGKAVLSMMFLRGQ